LSSGDTSRYSSTKADSPSLLGSANPDSTDNKEEKKESSRLPALSDSDAGGTKTPTPSSSGSHQELVNLASAVVYRSKSDPLFSIHDQLAGFSQQLPITIRG
jgi:hypothetical protein